MFLFLAGGGGRVGREFVFIVSDGHPRGIIKISVRGGEIFLRLTCLSQESRAFDVFSLRWPR